MTLTLGQILNMTGQIIVHSTTLEETHYAGKMNGMPLLSQKLLQIFFEKRR